MAKSKYPHIEWIDLEKNNLMVECAILKRDNLGNTYFIRLDQMDTIDKKRLLKIVTNRNADLYELWDLMSNVTLGNGVNALTYFHQLAKVATANGQIMKPSNSVIGVPGQQRVDPGTAVTAAEATAEATKEATESVAE